MPPARVPIKICFSLLFTVSYEQSAITYVWKNEEDTLRKSPSLTTLNAYLIQNQTIACEIKGSWRGLYTLMKCSANRNKVYSDKMLFIYTWSATLTIKREKLNVLGHVKHDLIFLLISFNDIDANSLTCWSFLYQFQCRRKQSKVSNQNLILVVIPWRYRSISEWCLRR